MGVTPAVAEGPVVAEGVPDGDPSCGRNIARPRRRAVCEPGITGRASPTPTKCAVRRQPDVSGVGIGVNSSRIIAAGADTACVKASGMITARIKASAIPTAAESFAMVSAEPSAAVSTESTAVVSADSPAMEAAESAGMDDLCPQQRQGQPDQDS